MGPRAGSQGYTLGGGKLRSPRRTRTRAAVSGYRRTPGGRAVGKRLSSSSKRSGYGFELLSGVCDDDEPNGGLRRIGLTKGSLLVRISMLPGAWHERQRLPG